MTLEAASATRLRRVEAPVALPTEEYRVLVRGSSLFGTLVSALLEQLNPMAHVIVVEETSADLRNGDVLVERVGDGRRLIVFGSEPVRHIVARHLADGVHSLIAVDSTRQELLAALASLQEGPAYVSPGVVRTLAAEHAASPTLAKLTHREREVLDLVATGLTNREIAGKLVVSPNTVRSHLQAISTKLGVSSRAKLAALGRSISGGT